VIVPQLTYAGHCDGVYGAREAAETDVVVLLRVRRGCEVAARESLGRSRHFGRCDWSVAPSASCSFNFDHRKVNFTTSPPLSRERTKGLARPRICTPTDRKDTS
jgi:hypothetical protein